MASTYPSQHADYPAPPSGRTAGRTYSLIAFVCAAVGVFLLPIVLGPAAIILGIISMQKGDHLGKWAIVAGVASLVVGIALGAAVMASR
jgi:hypothetical protein